MTKFEDLFKEIDVPIVYFKINKRNNPVIISANKSFVKKFTNCGEYDNLKGKYLNNLIVPIDKKEQSKKLDERTLDGLKNNKIIERKTPDGVRRFSYSSISYDENKGFAIYIDITDKIQTKEHVQVLNRILRHNLRNKITVISGLNNIINQETTNKDIENYTEKIDKAATSLENLTSEAKIIDKVLKDDVDLYVLNLKTQIEYALDNVDLDTSCVNIDIDTHTKIKAGGKLHVVIESLIDNAIRYNNSDVPCVDIYTNNINGKYTELCIKDNGPGIPKTESEIITENKEITELKHGSGLGLWLTKWIIEKYRGEINIENENRCGSNVKLKLLKYNNKI